MITKSEQKQQDTNKTKIMNEMINILKKKVWLKSRIFSLGQYAEKEFFVSGDKISIVGFDMNNADLIMKSLYLATVDEDGIKDFQTLVSDENFTESDFMDWLNQPILLDGKDAKMYDGIKSIQKYEKMSNGKDIREFNYYCSNKEPNDENRIVINNHVIICPFRKEKYRLTIEQNDRQFVYIFMKQDIIRYLYEKYIKRKR